MIYDFKCLKCKKKKAVKSKGIGYKVPKCCGQDMARVYSIGLTGKMNGGQFNWNKE